MVACLVCRPCNFFNLSRFCTNDEFLKLLKTDLGLTKNSVPLNLKILIIFSLKWLFEAYIPYFRTTFGKAKMTPMAGLAVRQLRRDKGRSPFHGEFILLTAVTLLAVTFADEKHVIFVVL
jgi:hypothetical protein